MVRLEKSYQDHKGLQIPVYSISGQFMGDLARDEFKSKFTSGIAHGEIYNVVDLKEMTWINSTGLGALIQANIETTNRRGHLVFANPSRRIESIFQVTHLSDVFDIKSDLAQAVEEAYLCMTKAGQVAYQRENINPDG